MTEPCPFCSPKPDLMQREFYGNDRWFAFLDKNPLTRGHATLARRVEPGDACPIGLTRDNLRGHDEAVVDVVRMLKTHYERLGGERPKDILFASLRGKVPHVHSHLLPLWASEESEWRAESGLGAGRLFTFLGGLELRANRNKRSDEEQGKLEGELTTQAQALKAKSG